MSSFSRVRADLLEMAPVADVAAIYLTVGNSPSDFSASTSTRLNDPVVDARARAEHGRNGFLQISVSVLRSVEDLFNEPSDTGLAEQLNGLWNAWGSVANNPGDLAARNLVLQRARTVARTLNASSSALSRISQGLREQVAHDITDINTAATALVQLNTAIVTANKSGSDVKSLEDQRDQLLMTLSDLAGAQATIHTDGNATVTVGGQTLVSAAAAMPVSVNGSQLVVGAVAASSPTGSIGAVLNGLADVVPSYTTALDSVANALAAGVNTVHQSGFDLAGNPSGPLFGGRTATMIGVLITDPTELAAAGGPGGNLDASVADSLASFGTRPTGPDAKYRTLVGALASAVRSAAQRAAVQQSVTSSVDSLAESNSGISLDEETTSMLMYQRAYQASARVLTTVDQMLDTLGSRPGSVGL